MKTQYLLLGAALSALTVGNLAAAPITIGYNLKPDLPKTADADHSALAETPAQHDARMQWWRDAKFGMFIHYGIYSGLGAMWDGKFNGGAGEWLQKNRNLDTDTYFAAAKPLFKPVKGMTEQWAKLAAETGCKYIVLTTKHHDGFALFNTKTSDYNAVKVGGFDIIKEYVASCHKYGLKVGFYHSLIDWHHPDYDDTIGGNAMPYPTGQAEMLKKKGIPRNHESYLKYLHAQVAELMHNYGKVDALWWDFSHAAMSGEKGWKAPELLAAVRKAQPTIIMNNRTYDKQTGDKLDLRCGDYMTPEQFIPKTGLNADWEACMTTTKARSWGYDQTANEWVPANELITRLVDCVTKGGNFLMNVGPRVDGSLPEQLVTNLHIMGKWVKAHADGIYSTRPVFGLEAPASIDRKGNVYVFVPQGDKAPKTISMPDGYTKAAVYGETSSPALTVKDNAVSVPALTPDQPCLVLKLSK